MSGTGHLSELDLLRGQVADLSRELAERDRVAQDLREHSDLLRAIVEGTAAETGEEFFSALVTHLTARLKVQYAIIGEVQEDRIKKIHTLAVSAGGALVDNFEYELTHTPCSTALTQTFACFDRDLQATFPLFQRLADLGAESYCAVPLLAKNGAVIGLLVVMDTKPLEHSDSLQSLLGVFAPRIAAEVERRRAEQERAQALADLHNVMESIPDVMFTLDAQGNMVRWNRRVEEVTGYSPEELLNKPALAFVPPEEQTSTATAIQRAFTEGYAELEGHLLTKDHRLVPYHWTGALLKNLHGEPIGITGIGRDVSDKKRAEVALRESEERLALAVEGSTDILWDAHRLPGEPWYAPQTPIWWSPRVRKLLGLQESDSFETLEQWAARLHPDDKDRVFGQLAAHIEHRVPYDVEYRLRTNAGDYCWIRGRGQALWDEQGEPRRMSGSCQDITERKRAYSLLLAVINSTADGLLAVDREGKVTIANKRFSELWRIPKALLDRGDDAALLDFVLEQLQEPEAFLRRVQELYAHPEQDSLDMLTFNDGRVFERYSRAQILEAEAEAEAEAEIVGRVWSFRDVTERHRAEVALRDKERLLRTVIETASEAIFMKDTSGRYLLINSAGAEVIGKPADQIVGRVDKDLFPAEVSARLRADDRQVMSRSEQARFEEIVPFKGESRVFYTVKTPLRNSQGEVIGLVGVSRDVTEVKQAEEALREMNLALANAMPGISRVGPDGRYLEVNEAYAGALGYDPSELIGEEAFCTVHPDDRPRMEAAYATMLREGKGEFEAVALRKDSSTFWKQVLMVKILDGEERYLGHHYFMRDITKRKQFEAMRARQYEALQAIFNMTVALSRASSLEEGYEQGIDGVQQALKVDRASILLFDDDGVMRFKASRGLSKEYTQAVEGHSPWSREAVNPPPICVADIEEDPSMEAYRGIFRAERIRALSFVPLWSSDGLLGKFMLYYDIPHQFTEEEIRVAQTIAGHIAFMIQRKRAEEALQESEKRYARATAVGKVGVWELDVAAGTYFGDANLKALFGYAVDELSTDPKVWLNLVHADDQSIAMDHWQKIVNGNKDDYTHEVRMCKKDGAIIWTEVRGHAVRDHEGQITHLFGATVDITERKQVQEALAQSEHQLRTVLDALPVGVWFTDRVGKPLLANPAAKQIWSNIKQIGLQTENNQAGWWETVGSANEPHRWALSHVLATGVASLNETFDFECLDGTKKVIRNSTVPVRDETGNILGTIVLNEDITMLRQAQEALRLTQFSVDHAVEGFFWIGPDARIVHVNEAACRMLEYTREELTSMTVHDIDPAFPRDVWLAHWEELKQTGSMTFESKHWSRTGRVLDTEVTVNYLRYDGKEFNCAIMRDIGERKRAEAALRASEERYRSLYDETPTMYFTLATDGTVRSVNRFGAEQLGYQVEELIGHSVLSLFHEDDKESVAASLSECLATPEITRHWEFRKLRKDGSMIWVREAARVGQSSAEETVVLVSCEDITVRRVNEQLLAAEKRILELIATDVSLQEVLTLMCQQFEELSSRAHYSILLLDPDGLHLRHGAAPSLPDAYVHAIDGVAIGPTVGSCGTAAFMRRQVIVSDIARDPLWADFHDLALGHGLRACWSTPVIASDGTVLGTFAVYYGNPQQPTEADLLLIGRAAHIACIAIERKRTADALHVSEERLNLATRGSNTGIWDWDLRTNEVYFSPIWKSMLGYAEHELRGEFSEWEARLHPEDRARALAAVRAYLDGATPQYELEHRLRHKDGSYRWILARGITLSNAAGNPYRMAGSHIDITERKQAEETLRLTQYAVDRGADMAFWIDRDARILYVNDAACERLGYAHEELLAMTIPDLDPDYQLSRWTQHWDELKEKKRLRFETRHRTKTGEIYPVEIVANYVAFEGQEYNFVFCRDITDRRQAEEVLHQRERALRAAIEERERISQDLHDGILQSLFAVGLTLEASKSKLSPTARKTFGPPLNQAIDQLNQVMREIRHFIAGLASDLLQGKDLSTALEHMLTLLTQNQVTRVRLAVEDRAAKAVSAEQSLHLFLVIQEAVSNCIRHGRAQEARVSLKMLKQGVRLSIRDNGRGFNQNVAKRAGHGLANMAARAQKIGGRFTILSKVNEGTRVVLDLPNEAADVHR